MTVVWTMTLRPMAIYHGCGDKRTACQIPLMGFGHRRPFRDAYRDLCRPCQRCFPGRVIADEQET